MSWPYLPRAASWTLHWALPAPLHTNGLHARWHPWPIYDLRASLTLVLLSPSFISRSHDLSRPRYHALFISRQKDLLGGKLWRRLQERVTGWVNLIRSWRQRRRGAVKLHTLGAQEWGEDKCSAVCGWVLGFFFCFCFIHMWLRILFSFLSEQRPSDALPWLPSSHPGKDENVPLCWRRCRLWRLTSCASLYFMHHKSHISATLSEPQGGGVD